MNKRKMIKKAIAMVFVMTVGMGVLGLGGSVQGTEYDVGGGNNDYATMYALASAITLQAGDVVNIYPGTYTDEWRLTNGR